MVKLWTVLRIRKKLALDFHCLCRRAEQELLYEREKLEAAFDQQLKKEVSMIFTVRHSEVDLREIIPFFILYLFNIRYTLLIKFRAVFN